MLLYKMLRKSRDNGMNWRTLTIYPAGNINALLLAFYAHFCIASKGYEQQRNKLQDKKR